MMQRWCSGLLLAAAVLAQEPSVQQPRPSTVIKGEEWVLTTAYSKQEEREDFREVMFGGGFRLHWPRLHVEILGQQGLILLDRDALQRLMDRPSDSSGLPRRSIDDPPARRALTPAVMRARIASFLRAAGQTSPLPETPGTQLGLDLPRHVYVEGGITVEQDGVLVARCERLWLSPLDDRMVLEDVELRYLTPGSAGGPRQTLVVRAPRLLKQGSRWTGRDVTLTSCTAGEPHVDLLAGEAEIIEGDGELEVWSRGNYLRFSGTSVLPLPNSHFYTGEQNELPIKRVHAGYSTTQGYLSGVDFGMQWNKTGGALHEFLTGRPANEFRGSWLVGVNYVETRGMPLDGAITYRVPGLYQGKTDGLYLADQGDDRREITTNIDGSAITRTDRSVIRTQNRFHLGTGTTLDLTAFRASDPAVYSEFFGGEYRSRELPETNAYLSHGRGNVLATLSGRFNLDSFSYADNRALAPSFLEELPVGTLDLVSQPIATVWDTAVVLDAATDLGVRRHKFDELFPSPVDDRTARAEQLLEFSAPFHLGPATLRPYFSARGDLYDENAAGRSDQRLALEAGIRAATRLQRTIPFTDSYGSDRSLRHVISPAITFFNRFHVDGDPAEFRQFDASDALSEQTRFVFELRNVLERRPTGKDPRVPREVVMLDLKQNVFPDAGRDNGGERLGLFEYELDWQPGLHLVPLQVFKLMVEGEHDWQRGMRTFDVELQFGKVAGIYWNAEYRADQLVDAAVGLGASAQMFGRWDVGGGAQYDLQTDDFLSYWAGLTRRDHDWQITLSASYNPYTDDVTFRINFMPRLTGQIKPRQHWSGADRFLASMPPDGY